MILGWGEGIGRRGLSKPETGDEDKRQRANLDGSTCFGVLIFIECEHSCSVPRVRWQEGWSQVTR